MVQMGLIKAINKRDSSLDIVRIVALFCVISIHFFSLVGFYDEPVIGAKMFVTMLARTSFMVCVPLFTMLTGYLMRKKELSKKYYSGLVKTLVIYVLASIACLLYKVLVLKNNISFLEIIKGILNFSLAKYSWYIEMYIGLFLLIPFLNIIYNNQKDRKQKHMLILTMLLLTSIPTLTNIYNFNFRLGLNMFFNNTGTYHKILPFWWSSLYPITYYFIGAYLNEYKFKISKRLNLIFLFVAIILFGTYNYFTSYGGNFIYGPYQGWESMQSVVLTVLLFVFITNIDLKGLPDVVKKILKQISNWCLGAYLVSYIFDDFFYKILNAKIPVVVDRFGYYIVIVPIIFICSLLLSSFLNFIYYALCKLVKCIGKIRLKVLVTYNSKK